MVRVVVLASAPPASAVFRKLRRDIFLCFMTSSYITVNGLRLLSRQPQISVHDLGVRFEIARGATVDDGALFHQEYARAELERGFDVLLDQEDRHASLVDAMDYAPDLRNKPRHDAFGRLVQDDQLGPHHETARDCEHLLLAPGKRIPRLPDTFLEAWKASKHVFLAFRVAPLAKPDAEIFQHGEIGEDAATLRDIADAFARHFVRLAARQIEAAELDRSAAARRKSHDCAQRRGLSHPVAPQQRRAFARLHLEIHSLQDVQLADMDVDVVESKHGPPP